MTTLDTLVRVFEHALDSIEIADPSGRYVYVNEAFERLTGFSRDEARGKTPRALLRSNVHPDEFYESIWKVIESGRPTIATMVSRHKDGALVTHELSITPHLDDTGAIAWYVGIRRDLTERVAREESLRRAAELFEEMFTNNPAIEILLDPVTGRIVDANPAAVAFYGWDRETLLTKRMHDINTLGSEGVEAALARVVREKRTSFHFVHRVASGELRNVEISSSAVHFGGAARLLSIIQDVTERERLEQELRRSQRMEAVGRLAGGIAHDFNNLLQVVFTSTALLGPEIGASGPASSNVARIEDAAVRAAELTRQLLLLSRGDASRVDLLDLRTVVASASRLIDATLVPELRLVTEPPPDVALPVKIGRASFEQVLLDLAARARDAMAGRGTIRIRARHVSLAENEVPALPAGAYAAIEFEDDGRSMSNEVRAHAFEPFYVSASVGQRSGLDLAVLYGIVQRAGGSVLVESRDPTGTRFRIFLPVVVAPPHDAPRTQDGAPARFDGRGLTVLLVDDEPTVAAVVALVLSHHGVKVLEATDVDVALELAGRHAADIDILLSDILMPKLHGPELARRFSSICPRARVVFMSGYVGDAWERGVPEDARLLAKPFTPATLIAAIRDAADAP